MKETRTDTPELDAGLAAKYPAMRSVHDLFYALVNTFSYVYCVTMNFEKMIINKKKDSKPVHMLAPYRAMTGKLTQAKMEPVYANDRVYHKDVIRPGVKLTQFAYNKKVHDRINQVINMYGNAKNPRLLEICRASWRTLPHDCDEQHEHIFS